MMTNLSDYTYETIIQMTIDEYIHNYGEAKFHKLIERISTSNKISGLISLSRYILFSVLRRTKGCYNLQFICNDGG